MYQNSDLNHMKLKKCQDIKVEPPTPEYRKKKTKKEMKCVPIKVWDGLSMESIKVQQRGL